MKKIIAAALAAMLCLCGVALAEGAVATTDLGEVEISYEQNPVAFEGGAAIILPARWTAVDPTEDMIKAGVFYCADDPDDAAVMGLAYAATAALDAQDLAVQLSAAFAGVGIIAVNGVEIVACQAADGSYLAFARADGRGGVYTMTFAPVPATEGFAETAALVLSTLAIPAETQE